MRGWVSQSVINVWYLLGVLTPRADQAFIRSGPHKVRGVQLEYTQGELGVCRKSRYGTYLRYSTVRKRSIEQPLGSLIIVESHVAFSLILSIACFLSGKKIIIHFGFKPVQGESTDKEKVPIFSQLRREKPIVVCVCTEDAINDTEPSLSNKMAFGQKFCFDVTLSF